MKQKRFIPSQRIKGSGKELFIINYEGSVLEIQRTSNLYEPLIVRIDGELLETVPSKQNKEIEFSTAEGKHKLQVWNERVENNLIPKIFVKDGIAIVIDGIPVKNSLADPMSRFGSAQAFIWLLTILLLVKGFIIPLLNIEGIKESQILIVVFLYIILFILSLSAALTFKLNPLRSTWIALVISIIESVEFFYSVASTRELSIIIILFAILRLSIIGALIFSLRNLKHILNYEQDEVQLAKPDYGSEKKNFWKRFSFRPKYVIIVIATLVILSGLYYTITEFIFKGDTPSIERDSSLEFRNDLMLPGLIPYRKGDNWGYANKQGEIVIEPKYSNVEYFNGKEFLKVTLDTLSGMVDLSGNEIIPCRYMSVYKLSNNKYFSAKNIQGLYGIIDENNNIIVPFEYEELRKHPDRELYIVRKGKLGVIDVKNNIIVPFIYEGENKPEKYIYELGLQFCDNFIIARKKNNDLVYYGLLNFDGKIVLNFQKLKLSRNEKLKNHLLIASDRKLIYSQIISDYKFERFYGIIDTEGNMVLPVQYENISDTYAEDEFLKIRITYHYPSFETSEGLINSDGHFVIPFEYEYLGGYYDHKYSDKYIVVNNDNLCGVINYDNEIILPIRYEDISIQKNNDEYYFAVKDKFKNKTGLIKKPSKFSSEEIIIPFEYNWIEIDGKNKNWIEIYKEGKCGIVDFNNNIILPLEYNAIKNLSEGLAAVKSVDPDSLKKIMGSSKLKGMYLLKDIHYGLSFGAEYRGVYQNPNYRYLGYTDLELASALSDTTVRRKYYEENSQYLRDYSNYESFCIMMVLGNWSEIPGKWGFFNDKGKLLINFLYDEVHSFKNGLAEVKYNGKWGVINKNGDVVIPIKYQDLIREKDYDLFEIRDKDYKRLGYVDINGVEYFE